MTVDGPPPARLNWRAQRGPDRVRVACGVARRAAPGRPGPGQAARVAGGAVLSVGAFLGGDLSFTRGDGVNQTTFNEGPATQRRSSQQARMTSRPARSRAHAVLLLRHNGHLHALHDRCSHRDYLLGGGEVEASPSPARATARASTFATARSSTARRRPRNPVRPATARARSRSGYPVRLTATTSSRAFATERGGADKDFDA